MAYLDVFKTKKNLMNKMEKYYQAQKKKSYSTPFVVLPSPTKSYVLHQEIVTSKMKGWIKMGTNGVKDYFFTSSISKLIL